MNKNILCIKGTKRRISLRKVLPLKGFSSAIAEIFVLISDIFTTSSKNREKKPVTKKKTTFVGTKKT